MENDIFFEPISVNIASAHARPVAPHLVFHNYSPFTETQKRKFERKFLYKDDIQHGKGDEKERLKESLKKKEKSWKPIVSNTKEKGRKREEFKYKIDQKSGRLLMQTRSIFKTFLLILR